jgi:internalin A
VIREAIDKPEGDIYASDLYGIKLLNADMSSIKDITGLERCINLENLSLSNNQITDVSSLSGLTNLMNLDLSSNQITDVSPLSGLANLICMDLRSNQIPDASTLRISGPRIIIFIQQSGS